MKVKVDVKIVEPGDKASIWQYQVGTFFIPARRLRARYMSVGKATTCAVNTVPTKIKQMAKILPFSVSGYTSPYLGWGSGRVVGLDQEKWVQAGRGWV